LASIGQQVHRLASGFNLEAAVTAAQEAIRLLRSDDVRSALPSLDAEDPKLRGIEEVLQQPAPSDLRRVLTDLTRFIQSLGISNRPFLALVQNAPDQQRKQVHVDPPLQKTTVLSSLEHHWNRGDHDEAARLLEGLVISARAGNLRSRALLGEIACSQKPVFSINIIDLARVLEIVGWDELTLQFMNPRRGLLIPGLRPERINPHFLSALFAHPPALPEAINALETVIRQKGKDPWGLRSRAARGLFLLTTPSRGAHLSPARYWDLLALAWPISIPAIVPEHFSTGENPRWDLYEQHLTIAFQIVEDSARPQGIREAALSAIWTGGPSRGPRDLALTVCSRTLDLADKGPEWVWPVARFPLEQLARSGYVISEKLTKGLQSARPENTLGSGSTVEPQRLIDELRDFVEERPPLLRLVSQEASPPTPEQRLRRITAAALELGSYGLILEPGLIAALMTKAFEAQVSLERLEALRRALYPLHSQAAVMAWLDQTGMPWPSHELPRGHQIEGALALLRWIRDHEREPEELRVETAQRYWETEQRLIGRRWAPVDPNPLEWWQRRLTQELPATLAHLERAAYKSGAPRPWALYLQNHPEILGDLRIMAKSPLPGTKALAEKMLTILFTRPAS